MIVPRRSGDRGQADHGWLNSQHTFSFADYHDARHMGFRTLRVINEDRVKPGMGFGTHPHKDMEIISWVLSGALAHRDSLGTGSVIQPGDLQRMSAGEGVLHSEFNASSNEDVHFLQIWILPEAKGLPASYEQKRFEPAEREGRLRLLGSRDGREGSVTVHQDVALYAALLQPGSEVAHALAPGRHAWVQVARGAVALNGALLRTGDGAAVADEPALTLRADQPSEVLLFDLA
jgi:redox-sensitive bicupin YhaK (pirin superfamily)